MIIRTFRDVNNALAMPQQPRTKRVSAADPGWDGRAEKAIGTMIERYLSETPAPKGSVCADAFARWARELQQSGEARLEAAGERHLRVLRDGI